MFDFNIDEHYYNNIHFIGIGGISMSGLAKILLTEKYNVSGSDANKSPITEGLEADGAKVFYRHDKENIKNSELIVYTDAISLDNEELNAAINSKKDIVDRATFLGALMKNYKTSIAVSGTHGKTSTTSMLSTVLSKLNPQPTILLGGNLDIINGNVLAGSKEMFLTEACEYKANILKYKPTTAIVLNIDEDHLDYFDNIDHIINTFDKYVKKLENNDNLILNIDDENTCKLLESNGCNIISFSIHKDSDYRATNICFNSLGYPSYDLLYQGKIIQKVNLKVMGIHNVYNSLASIAACHVNNIPFDVAIKGVEEYSGVHRRLELKGNFNDSIIIDDYAHHPTEIKSTLSAVKKSVKGKLICVFQPHTFTRTKLLLDSFAQSFSDADKVIITDIYAAREKDYGDIHSKTLYEAVKSNGEDAYYISTFEEIIKYLESTLEKDDVLLTMGAGDVYKIGEMLLNK